MRPCLISTARQRVNFSGLPFVCWHTAAGSQAPACLGHRQARGGGCSSGPLTKPRGSQSPNGPVAPSSDSNPIVTVAGAARGASAGAIVNAGVEAAIMLSADITDALSSLVFTSEILTNLQDKMKKINKVTPTGGVPPGHPGPFLSSGSTRLITWQYTRLNKHM